MNYKKLKNSAEKITMPQSMKERIIQKCEKSALNGDNNINSQTEYVFNAERVQPHRFKRAVALVATFAVVVSGIGYGHHLVSKNGTPNDQTTNMSESVSTPFGNFRELDYRMGDGRWDSFPQAKRDLISDFLNKVEWTYFADSSYYDEYLNENNRIISIAYSFFIEENGEYKQGIEISTDGIVRHWRIALENGVQSGDPLVDEFYKVDIETFTDGMEKILRMYLFGDFSQLDYCFFGEENFSANLFDSQKYRMAEYLNSIEWTYFTDENIDLDQYEDIKHEYLISITGENYYTMLDIYPDGTVKYRKQKLDKHRQPVGNEETFYYTIDIDDFRENIEKILKVSPFGDFRDIDYNIMGHEDISPEQRDRVSDLLNGFEWGEPVAVLDLNDEVSDYMFVWNTDDHEMWLQIFPDGYARYQISSRTESGAYHEESETFYKIDTQEFSSLMEEILSENKEEFPFGNFSEMDYSLMDYDITNKQYEEMAEYLNSVQWNYVADSFTEEEYDENIMSAGYPNYVFGIDGDCIYGIAVYSNGFVEYTKSYYEVDGSVLNSETLGFYKINSFDDFDRDIQEIINGEPAESENKEILFDMLNNSFNIAVVRNNGDISEINLSADKRDNINHFLNYDIDVTEISPCLLGNDYDSYILRYASNDYFEEIYVYDNLIVYDKLPLNTPDNAGRIDSEKRYYSTDLSCSEFHTVIDNIINDGTTFVTGYDAPFADLSGKEVQFTATKLDSAVLTQEGCDNIAGYFRNYRWYLYENVISQSDFAYDDFGWYTLSYKEDGKTYSLDIGADNTAYYSVKDSNGVEIEYKNYIADSTNFERVISLNLPYEAMTFPPFSMDSEFISVECNGVELDSEQKKAVYNVLFGWNWATGEIADSLLDEEPEYTFVIEYNFDTDTLDIPVNVRVYNGGTIELVYDNTHIDTKEITRFNDIDGDSSDICEWLRQALQ